ncbi:HK97 gp10 family phage protein [Pseudovibrio sp. SPO723]|uniref:HK97 gp10 family phage protein n=1 Tax=Nesiotobacter zosterae TaxID=392721 RepID=UPI0029C1A342|nr:HK97 gp10 family phage protein [Pseudovibrio sp. SPO723]MDX5592577.1 HK97 gp10 family phage protein [Pseudovibrio sp. SPO723]
MAKSPFASVVRDFAQKAPEAIEATFKNSLQELDERVKKRTPIDTGFLRNSWMASTTSMPALTRDKEIGGGVPSDNGGTIAAATFGEPFYFAYTARYAPYLEYGSRGRQGVGMVRMSVQDWPQIVAAEAKNAKSRFGI